MSIKLKEKAVKGVSWNLVEKFGIQGIKFILGIILARLLTPEDYGLIGMIAVFFSIAQVFVQSGFGQAYVQKREVSNLDASTIFYTNLLISLVLYCLLWFSAPAIAQFYNQPQLVSLTRVMGLVVVINSFNVIQLAKLTRAVNFLLRTKIILSSTLVSGIAGIVAALNGYGVWSLVIQQLSNRLFVTLGLWITSKWSPGIQFSRHSLRDMFAFGSWILFSSLLRRIFDNIYILVIGKFFPVAQLGFYTKAVQLSHMASNQIAETLSIVSFPIFSKLQDDKSKLLNGVRKFLQYGLFLITPILILLIVIAKPFVILLITEKWAPMIPYLQLLCIVGLMYPVMLVNFQLILAQGKGKLSFKIALIKNSLRVINIFVMYRFGVIFIILGEIILSFIMILIVTQLTKRLIGYGFWEQFKDIWKTLLSAAIALLFGIGINVMVDSLWGILILGLLTTTVAYLGIQYLINRGVFIEAINIKNILVKRNKNELSGR